VTSAIAILRSKQAPRIVAKPAQNFLWRQKSWGGAFYFRRATVFGLGYRLSKHTKTSVAEQLHCSLHVKELKVTTTELEGQAGN